MEINFSRLSQEEVKDYVDKVNNEIIEKQTANLTNFVLIPELAVLKKDLFFLRSRCEEIGHKYDNGKCKYCGKEKY